jgi:hypothetical protein
MPTQVNGCLTLTGSNHIQTSKPFDFTTFTTGMSISLWFRYTGPTGTSYVTIFDFGNGEGVDNVIIGQYGSSTNLFFSVRQNTDNNEFVVPGAWTIGKMLWVSGCAGAILWLHKHTHAHKMRMIIFFL